ncbi:MAG: WD40 repeat domain-containing protein, partial [Thermoplasmata archaeon]
PHPDVVHGLAYGPDGSWLVTACMADNRLRIWDVAAGGPWVAAPFALAGCVKIGYDVAVYSRFRRLRPPEEIAGRGEAPISPRALDRT